MKLLDGQWVYAAHNAEKSDIHFPACWIMSRPLPLVSVQVVSIPAYSKRIKQSIKEAIGDEIF